ncbi:MAG: DsrE family protein [Thiogranum sp.]|nr:DsrE family protein [Thiogranum sp.]
MLRSLLILILVALGFWFAADLVLRERPQQADVLPPRYELEPIVPPPGRDESAYVADVSAHTAQELETLFERVEALLDRPRGEGEAPLVTLVLHGPEVEFFALKNYAQHKALVDHAAKLAALGGVQISICQTQMRARGIAGDQVPSFLRQIPYGPDEVQRLIGNNYVLM